jgi:predicted RNA-binding Zn ribbon-like protein
VRRQDPVSRVGLYDAGPQSGARTPAPGRLGLVQAFVNSHFDLERDRGADRLATPAGLAGWLGERGLDPGAIDGAELRRAVAVREGLRALLAEHNGAPPDPGALAALRAAADGLPAAMQVDADGATSPAPAGTGAAAALGLVMAVVHEARAAGTWERLKACPGPHCGWAFYDHSRNGASSWCSMRVCGGRAKARAYRRRSHRLAT